MRSSHAAPTPKPIDPDGTPIGLTPEAEPNVVFPRHLAHAYHAVAHDNAAIVADYRNAVSALAEFNDPQTCETVIATLGHLGTTASLPSLTQAVRLPADSVSTETPDPNGGSSS